MNQSVLKQRFLFGFMFTELCNGTIERYHVVSSVNHDKKGNQSSLG